MGLFERLKKGLFKTRKSLVEDTEKLAKGRKVDDTLFAKISGIVKFERKGRNRQFVSVYPVEI